MAAYSRILLGAKNQLGTREACLLSANRELFPVQWNTVVIIITVIIIVIQ